MEEDKTIVYVKNEENRGAFYSRNNGVLNSRGEYVLLVDIDDFYWMIFYWKVMKLQNYMI